ncbi:hypothetical protein, partial [Escherichia coli]|uniref:hypothetical protein n=1 Tax=Escherichia coli TaxID=562 RepID=UPI00311AEFFA
RDRMTGTFAPQAERPAEPDRPAQNERPAEADLAPAVSPTVRRTARRAVPWIVLAAIAVLVALSGLLLNGGGAVVGDPLSAT